MTTTLEKTTKTFLEFLEKAPNDLLEQSSVILSNGIWNLHLEYEGEDYHQGISDLRLMAIHKPHLIKRFIASESPSAAVSAAERISEFCSYRDFSVALSAKDNKLRGLILKITAWVRYAFGSGT